MDEISREKLDMIVQNHVLSSMGAGMLPFPGLDLMSVAGIQINMIKQIAEVYEVPFLREAVVKALTSLLGHTFLLNTAVFAGSLIKTIPFLGQTAGMLATPFTYGASTYASAKIFIRHFSSGGNFLNFSAEKFRAYYDQMMKEGKEVVTRIKEDADAGQ